jgi:tetratricopeptide (TPR) repeat protein
MKKIILSLLVCSFLTIPALYAQESKPSAPPADSTPKKPEKEPVTALELYEAARWVDWNDRDSDAAIAYLNRAIAIQPDLVDAYFLRGHIKRYEDRCKEAVLDFDIVIQQEPDAINTYQYRGECKVRLKDYAGALSDFDMSVSLLAAKGMVQYSAFEKRGKLKYILGNYDGAIEDMTNAAKMDRSDSAYFFRALIYFKKGDNGGAIRDLALLAQKYEAAIKDLRVKYPDQYSEKKGYPPGEDPLQTLKKTAKSGASDSTYSAGRGSGSGSCKGCKETKFAEFEDKLVSDNWFIPSDKTYLSPMSGIDDAEVFYYLLGDLYEKRGDTGAAIKSFTESIIAKRYDAGNIYYRRGLLQMKNGDWEPAVRDFSWAISELDRVSVDVFLERGIAILMLGHDDLAQKDFDKFLGFYPDGKDRLAKRIEAAKKEREEMKKQKGTN